MTNQDSSKANGLQHPDLSWREDGQPVSNTFDDPYFSVENGLEESRYVFLQHNRLPERWTDWQGPFCILETGFGTGLNFLMTWQMFKQHGNDDCWLNFTSIEKYPMSLQQIRQAAALWPELSELYDLLLEQYPAATPGFHSLCWPEHRVQLTLILDDVHNALPQISGPVHAWYLDGFAPSRNPEMWQQPLFDHIRRICNCHPDQPSTLATFTSAGIVRRGLKGAGFAVKKVSGYGRKREMVEAEYARRIGPERPPASQQTPWLLNQQQPSGVASAIVIGAGLAGCTTARALAERGIKVTLLDPDGIAMGASGNPQGGLYIKLAANDKATHTDFYLAAYQTSLRWMKRLLKQGTDWNPCGVLQLGWSDAESKRQQKFLATTSYPEDIIRAMTSEDAGARAGCTIEQDGLFFDLAGWASPKAFCDLLVEHPNIEFRRWQVTPLDTASLNDSTTNTLTTDSTPEPLWTLNCKDLDGQIHQLSSSTVVIATANATNNLLPDSYLPTKSIRGQLTYLNESATPALNTVLCGRSYMAPAHNGQLVLGATYNLKDDETALRDSDHDTNLNYLADFGPQWRQLSEQALADDSTRNHLIAGGRVGFRCTTPDYLPVIGPVIRDVDFFDCYQPMVKNAKQIPAQPAPNHAGLWLNLGHGSRGLSSAPLCAEILAAAITGALAPASNTVREALLPGRFLLRDMVRRKIDRDALS